MAKVPANKKLQVILVLLVTLFILADQFVIDDLMSILNKLARTNGVSKNEFIVYILIFANIVTLAFPVWCFVVSNRIEAHKKFPYPGMLLPFDSEQLEGKEALIFAKRLRNRVFIFLLANIVVTIAILKIF